MKIGDEVYIHGYVDEIRQNVVIVRNDGGYFGTVAEEITSRSENPNTCGDAISREELIEALDTWDKFGYAPTNELIPLRGNVDKDKYVPYIHYDDVIECIKGMPSVIPQQRTGQWIINRDSIGRKYGECSECMMRQYVGTLNYCPNCGTKMEV